MKYHAQLVSDPGKPKTLDSVRILCISDTHGEHGSLDPSSFSPCDLVIFAGDLSMFGNPSEVSSFKKWFQSINCPNKLLIAGNLDLTFDTKNLDHFKDKILHYVKTDVKLETIKPNFLQNADFIYAEHNLVEITISNHPIRIFASPYTPEFMDFGFQYKEKEQAKALWDQIPNDIDVLVTHGPPHNICDKSSSGFHCGCEVLRGAIERVKPALSVFGHIHEAYGTDVFGDTLCCNVALVNQSRKIANKPTYVDLIPYH